MSQYQDLVNTARGNVSATSRGMRVDLSDVPGKSSGGSFQPQRDHSASSRLVPAFGRALSPGPSTAADPALTRARRPESVVAAKSPVTDGRRWLSGCVSGRVETSVRLVGTRDPGVGLGQFQDRVARRADSSWAMSRSQIACRSCSWEVTGNDHLESGPCPTRRPAFVATCTAGGMSRWPDRAALPIGARDEVSRRSRANSVVTHSSRSPRRPSCTTSEPRQRC